MEQEKGVLVASSSFMLDAEGIDRACEVANAFLLEARMSKREVIATRLSFENILLNC